MHLEYTALNWVAIGAAVVAGLVIGFVWYLPQIFGTRASALLGRPLPPPAQLPATTWVAGIVEALIVAYVLAVFVKAVGATTLADGAIVGFLAAVGLSATATFGKVLFEGRAAGYWAIEAGYLIVAGVVMGAILGAWR